jgi:RNA polymerase sigma-70 factor (ECF subfamily)
VDFEELANEHKDAVYRQMVRACGNHADAEDVLIEALLRAYRNLDQLKESAAFRGWLAQIGKRVCWRLKGRERLLPLLQLSALEDEGKQLSSQDQSPDAQVAATQMSQLLHQAVDSLESPYREVYQMRDLEELSGEEVTLRLGITLPAMKSRLHRARTMVREALDRALLPQETSDASTPS